MRGQKINELVEFAADHQWVEDNKEGLLKKYPDQWIAVSHGTVLASAPELARLLEKLPDPAHTCIVFVTSEPLEMVL
ncbi:MAG: DUF5678 domain-containing protein [Dehalococcoidia bacterium]|nr:DUF5678 domain-containing protein [Dehalococcoidia bacterium]